MSFTLRTRRYCVQIQLPLSWQSESPGALLVRQSRDLSKVGLRGFEGHHLGILAQHRNLIKRHGEVIQPGLQMHLEAGPCLCAGPVVSRIHSWRVVEREENCVHLNSLTKRESCLCWEQYFDQRFSLRLRSQWRLRGGWNCCA